MGALLAGWAALEVGVKAAHALARPHPLPVAWFEAGLTVLLVIGALVAYCVRGDD